MPNLNKISVYQDAINKMLRLSFPMIVAQVGTVLMGITDNIMVGDLGSAPLAAAGIANPIFFLIASIGMGVFATISPLIAKAKTKGEMAKAQSEISEFKGETSKYKREKAISKIENANAGQIFYSALKLSILLGFVLTLIILLISNNFSLFQQKPEVEELASSYLSVLATSTIPLMFFLAVKHFSDGLSLTRPAMVITLIGLAINVFFNWVLIYGHLGMTPMGLYGSGLSTLISRVIMASLMMLYVVESKIFHPYLPNPLKKFDSKKHYEKILKLGLPSGFQYFFELGAFSGAAIIVGWLGVDELAAHNIIFSIATFTYMIASGISFAGAVSVGEASGSKDKEKVLTAGIVSLGLVTFVMVISSTIILLFGDEIIGSYNDKPEILEIASSLVFLFAFYQISDGIQAVGLGILRGIYDVKIPTMITILAYWIVGLPICYVLSDVLDWGIQGAWVGLSLGLTTAAILLTMRFLMIANKDSKFFKNKVSKY